MFAFLRESTADSSEGFNQRKNIVCNQEVGILCSDRMPVHSFRGNRDFGDKIGPAQCDTIRRGAAQSDPANDAILFGNLFPIEEVTEFLSLGITRNRCRESDAKSFCTSALDPFVCSLPCSRPAVQVVPVWSRAVQADL